MSFVDSPAPPLQVPGEGELRARIVTTLGDILLCLLEAEAPRSVATFVACAQGMPWTDPAGRARVDPVYKGTSFHRVIPEFMIQGGDPKGDGTGDAGFRWGEEPGALAVPHDRPVIAFARTTAPSSQGCQFYLTEGPAPMLDGSYSVFGRVIGDAALIARIARVPRNQADRPITPVKIRAIEIFRAGVG